MAERNDNKKMAKLNPIWKGEEKERKSQFQDWLKIEKVQIKRSKNAHNWKRD